MSAVVRGALKRTTLDDRLAGWLRRDKEAQPRNVERYAGKAVYYLVMIFVFVAFFQALKLTLITEPLNALLTQLTEYAPRLLGAGVLVLAAWLVATILRALVSGALRATNLDSKLSDQVEGKEALPLSRSIADAVYWLTYAADTIATGGTQQHRILALVARVSIIALAAAMALGQMGLAEETIFLAFGLLLGSIAVAAALAFGLGGRELAGEQVRNWMRSLGGKREKS